MTIATKVKQLVFSDLYLGHTQLEDRLSDVPGSAVNPLPAGAELRADLDELIAACRAAEVAVLDSRQFKVLHDGVAYRVSVMLSQGGKVFVVRKIEDTIPSLAALGIPQAYIPSLMSKNLSGLFIVSGSCNAGKTMTACSLIKERLTAYGGIAVTGENPIELPLEGRHGDGVCYQTHVPSDSRRFVEAFRIAMRWGANTIMVDQIRDREVATEVLQASISGHLIITTMLAQNVIQTITKLRTLLDDQMGLDSANALLADGLLGVLHQEMMQVPARKLKTEFLFLKDAPLIRAAVRTGKYEVLGSDIRQQMTTMIVERAQAQKKMAEG